MGIKGSKMTRESALSAEELLDKLSPIGELTSKKMFGGHGLFHSGKMFGLIDSKGKCFLKANESNIALFQDLGSTQHSRMPYYSLMEEHVNEEESLLELVKTSIQASKSK